jgi:hypothetical protein
MLFPMQDLRNVHAVEVEIRKEGKTSTLWVNVDGKCELRVQMAEHVIVRTQEEERNQDGRKPSQIVVNEQTF